MLNSLTPHNESRTKFFSRHTKVKLGLGLANGLTEPSYFNQIVANKVYGFKVIDGVFSFTVAIDHPQARSQLAPYM